ncbi:MAG: cupredoxin domain-containing protein [Patescibacteria group bacterium]|jgi:plastocyanin|nr:cupredoxin domain-containing protein [Patescibacteria group bacterium]MDD5172815.1 cupredoxin domain-containing protein [Patescibacteria group bacterium]
MENSKEIKKAWLIVVALILIVLVIVFFGKTKTAPTEEILSNEGEVLEPVVAVTEITETETGPSEGEQAMEGQKALESAKTLALNMNQVSAEGVVLTTNGLPADNSALPGSFAAPYQSEVLEENEIPRGAIRLKISVDGFEPKEISAVAGKAVIIALTSMDENVHILRFEDESLRGIRIIVSPEETRAIVFNAPEKGDYAFYCEAEGHQERGESGTMRVK